MKENYEEYIVEFRITIVDPTYSELLSNPETAQYNDIARDLKQRVSLSIKSPSVSYSCDRLILSLKTKALLNGGVM